MPISTAIGAGAVARVLGIKTEFVNLREGLATLPQRLAIVGQGSTGIVYDTVKRQITDPVEVGNVYGFGSPLHLAVRQLLPTNGDGVGTIPVTIYPLAEAGGATAAVGDITPSGVPTAAAEYRVYINEIASEAFVISVGDSVADIVAAMAAAINGVIEMPVIAADAAIQVDLTSKWKGTSANAIVARVAGSTTAGNVFAVTQPVGGTVNPDVQPALDQVGNVWETMFLNCLDIDDAVALDAFNAFGEARWGELVRKPAVVFVGNTSLTVALATAISDARKNDRVNAQLVAPGSAELPLIVAARELARIVVLANENPPHDYGSQVADGIAPGLDGDQWNYVQRDAAVKAGSATIDVIDGVIRIGDVVTFYHPTGEPDPAYRFVVDIVKLQNIIFNLDLIFAQTAWDGAPLIPDEQPSNNPAAKKPKMAIAEVAAMIDDLALGAIISDPASAKKSIAAGISATNAKRLDLSVTVKLSGNTNIKSIDLNFGFNFGALA